MRSLCAAVLIALTLASCGNDTPSERSAKRPAAGSSLQWDVGAIDRRQDAVRLLYETGQAAGEGRLVSPARAKVEVRNETTYVGLHSERLPESGPVAAVRYQRCALVRLASNAAGRRLRDRTEPWRRPRIVTGAKRQELLAMRCPAVPIVLVARP